MLLVYCQKITPRFTYAFKHLLYRILGLEVSFTSVIEEFIGYDGAKMSYGKQPLGNELFVQEIGLLSQQGIEDVNLTVKDWNGIPTFFSTSEKSSIPFDMFSAAFYLLSRYEEYLPHVKDSAGRYPASESISFKHDFLELPIVDIWAFTFKDILTTSFSEITFPKKKHTIHNILQIQRPFQYEQKGLFRSVIGYVRDLSKFKLKPLAERTKVLLKVRKDPFNTFTWIVNVAKRSSSHLTAFFLLGENESYHDSLNTHRKSFKQLVKYVGDYKEIGLLYSGQSLESFETLQTEKKRIEAITNRTLKSAKQANFVLSLPENYRNLIELEIVKDFTMAYHDQPGFRGGTCTPFLFYDLDYEIKTPLLLHPVAVTTEALSTFDSHKIETKVNKLLREVMTVKGTFSMVFRNEDFVAEDSNEIWRTLFSETLQDYA
ncbi:hypothetical protein G5B37_06610 [Rasiella rasia]|uniref:DUF7033 domain-containing protein n=1 Tax=Rasiella rasia TaxID=2744027 RepID=A0A6G6GL47_9FLAO|nr:hypothetical protein [Rasiella rasia]QIE59244.1 hypothetical protein G5B37_06610 [Rasiella rasia]